MSNRSLPSAFIKTVLHNGVGRYVCQLSRLTFKFCKRRGDSRGVRLLPFARYRENIDAAVNA